MQVNTFASYTNKMSGSMQAFTASSAEDELVKLLKADSENPAALIKKLAGGGIQGYMAWQIEQMAAKIAKDVMSSMGVTESDLASMPANKRNEIAKKIMDEVKWRMEETLNGQMQDKAAENAVASGSEASSQQLMDFLV